MQGQTPDQLLCSSLDFNRLRYFWAVANKGGMGAGARFLGVTQPTVSTQIQRLEDELDAQLFDRSGRKLELTDIGRAVLRHADEIIRSGVELMTSVKSPPSDSAPIRLHVGVSNNVPKLIAMSLLEPAFGLNRPLELVYRERGENLMLAELVAHRIDLLLSDVPTLAASPGKPTTHVVGESAIGLFATPRLAARLEPGFPQSLQGAALVAPASGTILRASVDNWFEANRIKPTIVADADERAMMHYLASAGIGIVPIPTVASHELSRQYNLKRIGIMQGVREQYYAITVPRKLKNPAVAAILERARGRFRATQRQQR
jgi:LysR family transcriptional regulator, transcriptional activator of nhaA